MIVARDYQEESVDALFNYFRTEKGHPLVVLPTGTGKSLVMALFMKEACTKFRGTRIVQLSHVKELIGQNHRALLSVWPTAPAGINSAGLNRREHKQITFAGIASVFRKPELFGRVDLVIIDEAHRVSNKGIASYMAFLEGLKKVNPYLKVIGFTATPFRAGTGHLTESGLFTDVAIDYGSTVRFNYLLNQGWLSHLIPKRTEEELDVSEVRVTGGDYNADELQAAVDKAEITAAAICEAKALAADRSKWLVFSTGVQHSHHIVEELERVGIAAAAVYSGMSAKARDRAIEDFKRGKLQALVNQNILTTGFDVPGVDCILVLRPTRSASLWVQMLGRGTRPVYAQGMPLSSAEERLAAIAAGPKPNCLVLDFAANTRRLGPINDPVVPRKKGKKGKGAAPVRICDACGTYNHAAAKFCICCGEKFDETVRFGAVAAGDALIIGDGPMIEVMPVSLVGYESHLSQKSGKVSLRVTYYCGLRQFTEWVCLEHDGFAGKKGRDWWRERWPETDYVPETVAEALDYVDSLERPTHIRVWLKPKNSEVMAHDFTGTAFQTVEATDRVPDVIKRQVQSAPAVATLPPLEDDDIPF